LEKKNNDDIIVPFLLVYFIIKSYVLNKIPIIYIKKIKSFIRNFITSWSLYY